MSESQTNHHGYCHCCREAVTFEIRGPWLRDEYICQNCGCIPRQRALQHVLDVEFPGWERRDIHESSPSNTYLSRWAQARYSYSHFFAGVKPGTVHSGVRCEDLEAMSFADNSIDLFITQDVLEHVFHPDIALAEIARVLKPGGAHLFTVPVWPSIKKSYQRATINQGQIEYLMEEVYHGNPVGNKKSLVTWDYGVDFRELASGWHGSSIDVFLIKSRGLGIDGEFLEVFVARKPGNPANPVQKPR